jgi:hydrogenase maturation protease
MGNPLLRDDGIGIHVAREVEKRTSGGGIVVRETNASGAALLTLLEGFDEAVVVDAISTRRPEPGRVHVLDIERFSSAFDTTAPHGMNLYTALELGRRCGLRMPASVRVVAVEILDAVNVGEGFTPEVSAAAAAATDTVCNLLKDMIN